MESVLTRGADIASIDRPAVAHGHQMPLTFLHAGEEAHVIKVRGKDEMHHHLENLGFVPGAPLRMVSEHGGNVIVEIKGSQIALDKTAASKVIID